MLDLTIRIGRVVTVMIAAQIDASSS